MSSLTSGTRLGPYEITDAIGAGGMGEVYKARDTRLDRTVAIKILPPHVAADPAFRTRFEREARAISALEHPNICVLHDVGRAGEVEYLVMQYLEGETLASRLSRGPLRLDEAMLYATHIASALDKAHRAGILHRDLKPGNVMLARSGGRDISAKLLDFGLAKLSPVAAVAQGHTQQPTITSPLTGEGSILGTLLYMSPEQLEAREVDSRSDIFSFGAVLYEMVTGAKAFGGASQATIIAAILERDPPPVASSAPLTPPALERVVRKCLAKDPDRRWQSAADLCDELSWIAQSSGVQQQLVPIAGRKRSPVRPLTVAAGVLIAALAGTTAWALLTRSGTESASLTRTLGIPVPDDVRLTPGGIAVSPDGKTIVYAASAAGGAVSHRPSVAISSGRLYMRRFDASESTGLPGTERARAPFFSPDGLSIGFFTESALVRLSLLGGPPRTIVSVPPVTRGGVWLPDDTIVFAATQSTGLLRIPVAGANPPGNSGYPPLTSPDMAAGEKAHMWPSLLPGGGDILYTIRRGTASNVDDADIAVVNVATAKSRLVLKGAAYARYAPTGHLLFVRAKTLMAVPFDIEKKEVSGTPFPVVEGVASDAWVGGAHYTVAPDGTLLLMRGSFGQTRSSSVWVDRSGKPVPGTTFGENELGKPRISPDGQRAVFDGTSAEGDAEIYMADLVRGTTVRFSADPQDDFDPIWSADGKKVIWTALPPANLPFLVWRNADGTGATEPVIRNGQVQFAGSVSANGVLAYSHATAGKACDIWTVPLTGDRKAQPFIQGPAYEYGPEFSPDGKWIAYVSNEGSDADVYVVPYPGPGGKRRVTTGGAVAPAWSRDGKELFYQTAAGLMSVPVSVAEDMRFGEPRLLFSGAYVSNSREDGPREYDVAPGSNRFLMIKVEQLPGARPPSLEVMLNWWTRAVGSR